MNDLKIIKIRPSERDSLINQKFLRNDQRVTVRQRGWTEDFQSRLVILDNDEIWGLEEFFLNWQPLENITDNLSD